MIYNLKQISSFIYAFEGQICSKLKNIPPFLFVFTHLHASLLVYAHSRTLV